MKYRIPSLDGLRAISIGMVMVYHLYPHGLAYPFGNLGVRVFFVISGYLITGLLLKEQNETRQIDLREFYLRRALRIFPPFYVYLAFIAAAGAAGLLLLTRTDILEASTYTANYFAGFSQSVYVRHIWSLAIEEQFYILWPSLLRFGGRKPAFTIAAAFLFIAPGTRLAYWFWCPGLHDVMDRRFETVADALATGCLLAGLQPWLATEPRYSALLKSKLFYLVPIVPYLSYVVLARHPLLYYGAGITIANLAIGISIDRWVRDPRDWTGALLNSAPFRWIGVLSYSIYLWQQPFLDPEGTGFYTHFPLNLCLTAIISTGSFFIIERPFQRARTLIRQRATARVAEIA